MTADEEKPKEENTDEPGDPLSTASAILDSVPSHWMGERMVVEDDDGTEFTIVGLDFRIRRGERTIVLKVE